ncbi:anoctamin-10-like [Spea bombifrons]|uniref:anoctamin-10-like n=1 Tax=Spea bombifrons TaxID=233779 RepID=UPI002349756D|nr:anoctamin-10-like [Spea bombifrons]
MGSWSSAGCGCCVMDSVQTLAVIQLRDDIKPETKKWLVELLVASAERGGPHLLVHPGEDDEGHIILLSATACLLLHAAERLGLAKLDSQGSMRAFSYRHRENFVNSDKIQLFLTFSEQQFLLKYEVENLKVLQEMSVPGYPRHRLYPGQRVIHFLQKLEVVKFYPVHEKSRLDRLQTRWYRQIRLSPQPIDAIRGYFGEPVAFYFDFLGFFTLSLAAPMLLSYLCSFSQSSLDNHMIFAVFNILWSTVTMELWKRHSSVRAYFWGTLHMKSYMKPPRAQFWGCLRRSPITAKWELYYPQWRRTLKILCVTAPTVFMFLGLSIDGMVMFLYWEERTRKQYQTSSYLSAVIMSYLPSVSHTLFMETLNSVYKRTATALTEWENHRLESSFQKHLTIKVLVFRFVNCFGLLFYIAFYLQDVQLLRKRLSSLLIVSQVVNQVCEVLLPYLQWRRNAASAEDNAAPFIDGVVRDGERRPDPGLFDDYMELFVQFGYVSLFSCVYPPTAALLVLNNVTEIHTDAFKLCQIFQKPFPEPADSIGVWQVAFEALGYFSVITNCFFLCISAAAQTFCQSSGVGADSFVLYMLGAEHLLVVLKLLVAFAIPDKPSWLRLRMMRTDFCSLEALKESARKGPGC